MSHLLDTNFLIACGWQSHADHPRATRWLPKARAFSTCPATQMGFMRVSLSPGYGADFRSAGIALENITAMPGHRFVSDSITASQLPVVRGTKEVTDAHLSLLARHHGLKLATLDTALLAKSRAATIAENPL